MFIVNPKTSEAIELSYYIDNDLSRDNFLKELHAYTDLTDAPECYELDYYSDCSNINTPSDWVDGLYTSTLQKIMNCDEPDKSISTLVKNATDAFYLVDEKAEDWVVGEAYDTPKGLAVRPQEIEVEG